MGVQLAKSAIDLGIVISDSDASLRFYRDVLGLDHVADIDMAIGGGAVMHRLQCGDTVLKLVNIEATPPAGPGGGLTGATGIRYFTMIVDNLDEIVAECEAAGVKVVVPISEARPGVTIAIVTDPDGNWVEFVRQG